jgi:hypothetical protein
MRVVLNKYIDGLSRRTQCVREEEKYYRYKRNTLILKEEQGESLGYQHQPMPKEEEEEEEEEEHIKEEQGRLEFKLQIHTRQSLRNQVYNAARSEVTEVHQTITVLKQCVIGCIFCLYYQDNSAYSHRLSNYTEPAAEDIREGARALGSTVQQQRWESYSCYFKYRIPQAFYKS